MDNHHHEMASGSTKMSIGPGSILTTVNGSGTDRRPGQLPFNDKLYAGYHFARALRLQRLFRHSSKLVIVPLDHSVTDGPIARRGRSVDQLVGDLAASGGHAHVQPK